MLECRINLSSTHSANASGPFCDHLGIRPEHTIEFQSVRTDDEGTLLLDLTTAKRRVTSYGGGK